MKASIKNYGQWYPIVVTKQGIILDGHHRFKACQELNIEPKIEIKSSLSEIDQKIFVIDSNLKRRQLNDFQKAELGYSLEGVYSEAAKLRQLSSLKVGNKNKLSVSVSVPLVSNDNNGEKAKGRTSAIIAKQIGISASIYNRAKKIILEGSQL